MLENNCEQIRHNRALNKNSAGFFIKTFLTTAIAFVAMCFVAISFLNFFMPIKMGNLYYETSLNEWALSCYNRAYKNSTDINDQFFMLNFADSIKNYNLVLKYADKIEKNADYSELVSNADNYVLALSAEFDAYKPYLLNEKNNIEQKFVNALIKTRQKEKAKQKSLDYLFQEQNVDEDFCFSLHLVVGEKVDFSQAEKTNLKNKFAQMDDFYINNSAGLEKFARLSMAVRMCDFSETMRLLFPQDDLANYNQRFNFFRSELEADV